MTKFYTPLFFSVPFLAGAFSLALVSGNGIINNNSNNALAEAEVLVTCTTEFNCIVEDLLPQTIKVSPDSGNIDVSANTGEIEIGNPDKTTSARTGTFDDNTVENTTAIVVIPDEIKPIIDPENATGIHLENNDSGSIVIEIEPTGPIVDPAPKEMSKDVLEEISDKTTGINNTKILIPKVPNTGRPQ